VIEGFVGADGPCVEVRAWLHRSDIRSQIDLLFDPASSHIVLTLGDLFGLDTLPLDTLPPDDVITLEGVFGVLRGLPTAAILSFTTEASGVHPEFVTLLPAEGPARTWRLGRDVLNRSLTVYEPRAANLLFQPYDSDEADDADAR
jgi:hypothetical protein